MSDTIIVAILSLIGTLAGTFGGILVSNKLTNYRIAQLEKKSRNITPSSSEFITSKDKRLLSKRLSKLPTNVSVTWSILANNYIIKRG